MPLFDFYEFSSIKQILGENKFNAMIEMNERNGINCDYVSEDPVALAHRKVENVRKEAQEKSKPAFEIDKRIIVSKNFTNKGFIDKKGTIREITSDNIALIEFDYMFTGEQHDQFNKKRDTDYWIYTHYLTDAPELSDLTQGTRVKLVDKFEEWWFEDLQYYPSISGKIVTVEKVITDYFKAHEYWLPIQTVDKIL